MKPSGLRLGRSLVGPGHPAYIIAELACAHEGDYEFARDAVDAAAETGVSAIKFQVFKGEGLVVPTHPLRSAFEKYELTGEQWVALTLRAHEAGLDVLIDVFDPWSLKIARTAGADGLKVHSTNVANPYFLAQATQVGLPMILGVGGTLKTEIETAVHTVQERGTKVCLMHGFQDFPTALEDTHLRRIASLAADFHVPVGFAGHAAPQGDIALWLNLIALGAGANLLENHFTLESSESRTDHHSSLLPDQTRELVMRIRRIERALGSEDYLLGEAESNYRATFKAFIVSAGELKAGQLVTEKDLAFKRAEHGLLPTEADKILGRPLAQDVAKDEPITESMLRKKKGEPS